MGKGISYYEQKLEMFLSYKDGVHKLTKKGNHKLVIHSKKVSKKVHITAFHCTKNTIDDIGCQKTWEEEVVGLGALLTKKALYLIHKGQLIKLNPYSISRLKYISSTNGVAGACLSDLLIDILLYNHKCSWIKEHKALWSYFSLLRSFSSYEEFKGFIFPSADDRPSEKDNRWLLYIEDILCAIKLGIPPMVVVEEHRYHPSERNQFTDLMTLTQYTDTVCPPVFHKDSDLAKWTNHYRNEVKLLTTVRDKLINKLREDRNEILKDIHTKDFKVHSLWQGQTSGSSLAELYIAQVKKRWQGQKI